MSVLAPSRVRGGEAEFVGVSKQPDDRRLGVLRHGEQQIIVAEAVLLDVRLDQG